MSDRTYLLVELQPGLHHSRVHGLFSAFLTYPGVVSVTDLAAISRKTLDTYLRQPAPRENTLLKENVA